MGDMFLVVYDGKRLKTYSLDSLSSDKPLPINEFKVKVERDFLFGSPDYSRVFCLGKKLEVLSIDPLSGELSVRVKSFKDLCKEYDVYFEDKESISSLSSSINGDYIFAVVGGDGIVVSRSSVKVIEGIEYRVKYKTREYLGTEIDEWGAWRIKEKEEEHFYTEKAYIIAGCISPNGSYIATGQDGDNQLFLTLFDLKKSKYMKLKEIRTQFMMSLLQFTGWLRKSNKALFVVDDLDARKKYIYTFHPETEKLRELEINIDILSGDINPIEDKIAFTDNLKTLSVMSIMDEKIDVEKLYTFKHTIENIKWSPDGKYLSVITNKKDIYVMEHGEKLLGKVKGKKATWYVKE